ncbi:hypothetical protein D3C73_932340 [compost metagenome]
MQVEGVGTRLAVRELILALEPRPPGLLARGGHQHLLVLQGVQAADVRMGQQPLWVALEGRGHCYHGQALLHALEDLQVVVDDEVGLLVDQQLHAIDLRPTHANGHVQAFLLVQTIGQGLVETTLFGLGIPGSEQHHLVIGQGQRRRYQCGGHEGHGQHRAKRLTQGKANFHDVFSTTIRKPPRANRHASEGPIGENVERERAPRCRHAANTSLLPGALAPRSSIQSDVRP